MPRLSEEKLQQIRSSVDIVDVIGNYLPLHKKGKGYWAVCPFHDDKNPSMSVSQELQIYKCFVCNAGGNVFTFLKDYLKISYIEAVKMCAEMAGIDVPELNSYRQEKKIDDKLVPLYQMHSEASKIYQLFLDTKPALKARDYLLKRHLDERIIKEFQIGYAPNDDSLKKAFTQLNFSPLDMARSGLVVEGRSGYYDRFKERIVFPLWDSNGQVIGFSGRIYLPDEQQAKYMNSPESEIFTKGDMLYHYAQSKSAIKKAGFAYLLEGFMDVIALYRAGLENAVALMGTALTKSHLTLLRKVTDTIYLCLDGDRPGLDAMGKASQVLLGAGFKVRIICLPQGMDPDELLENFGQEALINALNKHISVLEFKINDEYEKIHKDNYEERRSYLEKIAKLLCQVEDAIDLDYYIDLVFYNYILKCFVLIDLKTNKITHQDVGQMDMYVRMYDELKKREDDNPTIGIVLCEETDEDIARYSILHGNEQLFASKYKLYLPDEDELRREISRQKAIFQLQQKEKAALKEVDTDE